MSESNNARQTDSTELDRLFSCLSNPFRRRILVVLSRQSHSDSEILKLDDLRIADSERDRFRWSLYQRHLLKLEHAGYVSWEDEPIQITRGPDFEAVEPLIDRMADSPEPLLEEYPDV